MNANSKQRPLPIQIILDDLDDMETYIREIRQALTREEDWGMPGWESVGQTFGDIRDALKSKANVARYLTTGLGIE